jgi:hypothetical protein
MTGTVVYALHARRRSLKQRSNSCGLTRRAPRAFRCENQGFAFSVHNPVGRFFYGRVKYSFQ